MTTVEGIQRCLQQAESRHGIKYPDSSEKAHSSRLEPQVAYPSDDSHDVGVGEYEGPPEEVQRTRKETPPQKLTKNSRP